MSQMTHTSYLINVEKILMLLMNVVSRLTE